MNAWKMRHLVKGACTFVPGLYAWKSRNAVTRHSDSARYCYSVWLRHQVKLARLGVTIQGATVGELGPGDSLGVGMAALLAGAASYSGLDVVPYAERNDSSRMLRELKELYVGKEPIPGESEFPHVRPKLDSYAFPATLLDTARVGETADEVMAKLDEQGLYGNCIRYVAPWNDTSALSPESLDVIVSQAVLEHVDDLESTYSASYTWLRKGGYASHVIDFACHGLSPVWNGHWTYDDWEWQLVRGARTYLINREPLQTHIDCAKATGFEIVAAERYYDADGADPVMHARRFRSIGPEDARTRAALLVLRKPLRSQAPFSGAPPN